MSDEQPPEWAMDYSEIPEWPEHDPDFPLLAVLLVGPLVAAVTALIYSVIC